MTFAAGSASAAEAAMRTIGTEVESASTEAPLAVAAATPEVRMRSGGREGQPPRAHSPVRGWCRSRVRAEGWDPGGASARRERAGDAPARITSLSIATRIATTRSGRGATCSRSSARGSAVRRSPAGCYHDSQKTDARRAPTKHCCVVRAAVVTAKKDSRAAAPPVHPRSRTRRSRVTRARPPQAAPPTRASRERRNMPARA